MQDTKRIFILEDDESRMKFFRRGAANLFGEGVIITHANNAHAAKKVLRKHPWDLIYLDHDLGGEQMVSTKHENTGSEVARWIAENEDEITFNGTYIIIHSFNPDGARHMRDIIDRTNKFKSVLMPGIWLKPNLGVSI